MGRHRSDPRGLARILIAALAVALALALLVVGGMALVNALTSKSSGPGAAGPATNSAADGPRTTPSQPRTPASPNQPAQQTPPLVIKVTGAPTAVFVTVAGGGGQVLQSGTLNTGESRQYDQTPLNVVVANAAAVQVTIYGREQPAGKPGQRGEWFVPKK